MVIIGESVETKCIDCFGLDEWELREIIHTKRTAVGIHLVDVSQHAIIARNSCNLWTKVDAGGFDIVLPPIVILRI